MDAKKTATSTMVLQTANSTVVFFKLSLQCFKTQLTPQSFCLQANSQVVSHKQLTLQRFLQTK